MTIAFDVAAAALAAVLLGFTTVALVLGLVGLEGGFTGERFERCPRCHRYGMTFDGRRHPLGCPPGLRERLTGAHLAQSCQTDSDGRRPARPAPPLIDAAPTLRHH